METLTKVALARRWSPVVFSRLVAQLSDSEIDGSAEFLLSSLSMYYSNVLYLEYILALATNPKSLLPMDTLLESWLKTNWKQQSTPWKTLLVYLAKGLSSWKLPLDRASSLEASLDALVDQAVQGCQESLLFIYNLGKNGPQVQSAKLFPHWHEKTTSKLKNANVSEHVIESLSIARATLNDKSAIDHTKYTPSRTFRLLWLSSLVSTLKVSYDVMAKQMEVVWPNERIETVVYEVSLTAFDAYAIALNENDGIDTMAAFVTKKLPLFFKQLKNNIAPDTRLDGALIRLLTTADKDLVSSIDRAGDLRYQFTKTCIEVELCEEAVMNALHKVYVAQDTSKLILDVEPSSLAQKLLGCDVDKVKFEQSFPVLLVKALPSLSAQKQVVACSEIHKILRKGRSALSIISWVCTALINCPEALDALFLHTSLQVTIEALLTNVDAAAAAHVSSSSVYAEVGTILCFIRFAFERYGLSKNAFDTHKSWALNFVLQNTGDLYELADLSDQQSKLLGEWIQGLFGNRGVSDDQFKPACELLTLFPPLMKQIVAARQAGVLDLAILKSGMDYFVQSFLVPTLPIILPVLAQNLWEERNTSATLEVLNFLLGHIQSNSPMPAFAMVLATTQPTLRGLLSSALKLDQPLAKLVKQLTQPVSENISGSIERELVSSVKSLSRWQERPTGIPSTHRRLMATALQCIGPQATRRAIWEALGDSPVTTEVTIALLVIYGSGIFYPELEDVRMLDIDKDDYLTQIAAEYAGRLSDIFKAEAEANIQTTSPEMEPAVFVEAERKPEPLSAPTALSFDVDNFGEGLDLDVSIPMDLDELDSAMDLNIWE